MGSILSNATWINSSTSVLVVSLVACMLVGCGGSDIPLGEVRGTITLNGQPAAEVGLEFIPADGGRHSHGRTDASGNYRLGYNPQYAGALLGGHKVRLNADGEIAKSLSGKAKVILTTDAKVDSGNNVIDFELSDLTVTESSNSL